MTVIGAMHTPNENIVALLREGARTFTRLYVREPDSEHEVSEAEAAEFVKLMRANGGVIVGETADERGATYGRRPK